MCFRVEIWNNPVGNLVHFVGKVLRYDLVKNYTNIILGKYGISEHCFGVWYYVMEYLVIIGGIHVFLIPNFRLLTLLGPYAQKS